MDADEYRRMAAAGERHWWYRSTRTLLSQLMAPYLDTSPDALYLDAGGGTGATGGWMTSSAPAVLADFDEFSLAAARDDFPGYLPAKVNLNHLSFADDSFSAVLCVTALCHRMNPDPAAIVREFARITRPGGLVCILEPGGRKLHRGHDEVTHTGRRFSVRQLKQMAVDAGLDVRRATGAYSFLVPPAALLGVLERGKQKSDVGRNETGLGGLLGGVASLERWMLRRISLPIGLSRDVGRHQADLIAVARRRRGLVCRVSSSSHFAGSTRLPR